MRPGLLGAAALVCASAIFGCGKPAPAAVSARPENAPLTELAAKTDVPAPETAAQKLFEGACSECHALTRVRKYNGADPWDATVHRMIAQHGAKVAPDAAKQIVGYLDQTLPKK